MNAIQLFFNTIQNGNIEHVKLQLQNTPKLVHEKDARGFTPLIFATYFNKNDIAKLLVEHHADVDAIDASGNTALMGVCFKGNLEMITHLLNHNANINLANTSGITPLIFSAMYNQIESVKLLLDHSADTELQDINGYTALDYAKKKGYNTIISLLD